MYIADSYAVVSVLEIPLSKNTFCPFCISSVKLGRARSKPRNTMRENPGEHKQEGRMKSQMKESPGGHGPGNHKTRETWCTGV